MADTLLRYMKVITDGANTAVMPAAASTKTVLSVMICNVHASTDVTFDLYAYDGSTDHAILNNQSLPAQSTFIWDSKLIFEGSGEYLSVDPSAAVTGIHVVTTYLDQTS